MTASTKVVIPTGPIPIPDNIVGVNSTPVKLSPLTPSPHAVDVKTPVVPEVVCQHDSGVECVATTQDFRWVMTGDTLGVVRRYDLFASFNGLSPLTPVERRYYDGASRGGHLLGMFDAGDKTKSEDPLAPRKPVYSIALHPQAVWGVSGSQTGTIRLWSVRCEEGVNRATMAGTEPGKPAHVGPVVSLKLTDNATALVSGSWDKLVRYFDLNSCKAIHTFKGHTGPVTSVAVHESNPDYILSSSADGCTRLWDRRINGAVRVLRFVPQTHCWINTTHFGATGLDCFSAKRDGFVDRWDLGKAEIVQRVKASPTPRPVTALCVFPDNRTLATGSSDAIRLWDLQDSATMKGNVSLYAKQSISGHKEGGDISAIITDAQQRFIISTSGARGWGSKTDKLALMYRIGGIPEDVPMKN